jgi:SAM-dependent methyltransferase
VIEHVPDPDRFVQRAAEVIRPGGYLFITTGDLAAWLPRLQGPRWRLIHPPTHLHYFSRDTLSRLLRGAGFEVVEVRYPGYWRSIGEILHGLFVVRRATPAAPYRWLRRLLPLRRGLYVNTFDIMCVAARRS